MENKIKQKILTNLKYIILAANEVYTYLDEDLNSGMKDERRK